MQHSDLQTISKIPDVPSHWGLSRSLCRIAGLTRSCSVKTTCVVIWTRTCKREKITLLLSIQYHIQHRTSEKTNGALKSSVADHMRLKSCVRSRFNSVFICLYCTIDSVSQIVEMLLRRIIFKTFMTAQETLNSCQLLVLSLFKENLLLASSFFVHCYAWTLKKLWADCSITEQNNLH